jgi:hypothetical protein
MEGLHITIVLKERETQSTSPKSHAILNPTRRRRLNLKESWHTAIALGQEQLLRPMKEFLPSSVIVQFLGINNCGKVFWKNLLKSR